MVRSEYIKRRYIGSPETIMDMDIRRIREKGFETYLKEIEEADLSETFWICRFSTEFRNHGN